MAKETIFVSRKNRIKTKKLPRFLAYVLLLLFSLPTTAMIEYVEGWAHVTVVYASPELVICSKSVSGEKTPELFALDPKAKKVMWRNGAGNSVTRAVLDGIGNFVMVESGDELVCRNLKRGQIVWEAKMSAIRPMESAWRKVDRENSSWATEKANRYKYKGPFIRNSEILIFREAVEGFDCLKSLFTDWLLFDVRNGSLLGQGAGEYIGGAEHSFLLKNPRTGSLTILEDMERGEISLVPESSLRPHGFDRMDVFYFESHDVQYLCQGRCIIRTRGHRSVIAIFDANSRQFAYLTPTSYPKHYVDWILLPNYIVRYSRMPRTHWIEVYDFNGKLLATQKLLKPNGNKEEWLKFVGTTADEKVLFLKGNRLLVLEVPTLRIIVNNRLGMRPAKKMGNWPGRNFFKTRKSDISYEVLGNISFRKMGPNEVPHEICVNLIDSHSGKRIWQHVEKVVIRRIKR